MPTQSLYERVVSITEDYIGPAARRFIDRHIQNHLQIKPDQLDIPHLKKLSRWTNTALGYLTNDSAIVDEYAARLSALDQTEHSDK